jgi:preprotein translocase subunit SecY
VFRFLSFVPLPGVNPLVLQKLYAKTQGGILDIFNTFSGGSLERMSLIALGVMPTSRPRSWCSWPPRCTRRWLR